MIAIYDGSREVRKDLVLLRKQEPSVQGNPIDPGLLLSQEHVVL